MQMFITPTKKLKMFTLLGTKKKYPMKQKPPSWKRDDEQGMRDYSSSGEKHCE